MVGAIWIASALIFGAIAGGVVVHRLQAASTAGSEQQGDQGADHSPAPTKNNKHAKHAKHANQDNQSNDDSAEPGDDQDKDA